MRQKISFITGCVDPKVSLEASDRKVFLFIPGIERRFLGPTTCILVTRKDYEVLCL